MSNDIITKADEPALQQAVWIDARAHEIADDLIGTCRSKHEFMSMDEIEDRDLEAALNSLMFECDCCGWWASTDELHNDASSGQTMDEMCEECFDGVET